MGRCCRRLPLLLEKYANLLNYMDMKMIFKCAACFAASLFLAGLSGAEEVLRIGHFPNVTHAQGMVAHQLSRQGKGWFEERLGKDVKIEWMVFNAGPSAMEAMLAGAVDITYVGPNPALNAFSKSRGRDIRILSGSADGAAALVFNPDLKIDKPGDFKGKKIGTPQLGNTQDVACRAWLIKNGMKVSLSGGDAYVIPTANPDQLPLFKSGKLDAVWTVEPWVTRLEKDANAKVFLEQKDAVTTVLVTNVKNLEGRRDLVKKFWQAHRELTDWIKANPEKAQDLVHKEIEDLTGGKCDKAMVVDSWKRLILTNDVNKEGLQEFMDYAYECGFIKRKTDISKIFADFK